eukprot:gnl/TRDRNA2_/TRDRNA2_174844_c0_seq2.p1 gnl/TRDRNA2_/TRDRNA2_174844_c0~~gnl/TRDRNA2_/TRDRNA2_174844_c0_seq2.p1  ORF type:complete len:329 (-),score=29.19 gnl/TRDRNA2_/TRDRNA2_174844_c0_seq2:293-1279(-)
MLPKKVVSSTIFRQGVASLTPVHFDLCEPYGLDDDASEAELKERNFSDTGAYKASFKSQSSNPFVHFEASPAGQQVIMVLILVFWALFKVAGIITEFALAQDEKQPSRPEEKDPCYIQKATVMVGKWILFTGTPSYLLAPWTSMHVHQDCPQMAVWRSNITPEMYFGNVILAACLLSLLYVICPVLAFTGAKNCCSWVIFGTTCLMGMFLFIVMMIDIGENTKFPSFPINWSLLFDFSWPEYDWAWTASWFRLFAFMIFAWESAGQGIAQMIIVGLVDKMDPNHSKVEAPKDGKEETSLPLGDSRQEMAPPPQFAAGAQSSGQEEGLP